jgi:hypothetical protein
MKTDRLELAAARVVLGLLTREELPGVAVQALQDGCESQSIIWLAGLSRDEMHEARTLFEAALSELGRRLPGKWESVMVVAREEARAIVEGTVDAYTGALRIWDLTLLAQPDTTHELDTFIYPASEWPSRPDDGAIFEEGVRRAAEELVGLSRDS